MKLTVILALLAIYTGRVVETTAFLPRSGSFGWVSGQNLL